MNIAVSPGPCKEQKDSINYLINAYTNILLGLSFSPFSSGLLYYLSFTLIFEMKYAFDIKCRYNSYIVSQRLILFFIGIGAFVIGRKFIVKDKNPFRTKYKECPSLEDIWWAFKEIDEDDFE